jgi:hypothetical protein
MRTRARLRAIVDPLDLAVGQTFQREDIPPLLGETFNPGNWNAGHVVLDHKKAHVLLVTLNKQGKASEHRYHDYWIDEHTFHWQSQNSTTPSSKKGRELIEHAKQAADRVRATGQSFELDPMNSYYRRIVHNLFVDDPQIMSVSEGGNLRFKRMTLKKRPAK